LQALVDHATASGLTVWVVAAAVALYASIQNAVFLTPTNVANLLNQMLMLGVAAVGETVAVLAGQIDLSVGSVAKISGLLSASLISGQESRVIPVLLMMMALGLLVGFINGVLVTQLRVHSFIVTLGMFGVLRGLSYAYSTQPTGKIPTSVVDSFYVGIGPIPAPVVLVAILFVAIAFVLGRTAFGRRVYAVGGDPEVARLAGIKVDRVTVAVLSVSGLLAAVAGTVETFRTGVGSPTLGDGLELAAITAVVLGGTSLFGGRGRLIGTLGGVFLLSLIDNALNLTGVSSFYQDLVRGIVIVAAVAIFIRRE
jgi:ribose transport system permease protein